MSRTRQKFFLLGLFALLIPATMWPQLNFGRISGTVTDSSGALAPNAGIKVTEQGSGITRTYTTNNSGLYVATNLPVGYYTVTVELAGFQSEARAGLNLVADGRLTVDFSLQPGAATQTVDVVAASGEAVNTTSGEIARQINMQQVQDLALNGRNYTQLADLIPGSALTDEDQMALTSSLSVGNRSINGSRVIANVLMIDGAFNMDSGSNGSQINNVGVDFIREVNIHTSNFSAEYGRNSGAAINAITRSGTNQFHGGAFEFLRNNAVDARNFFSPTIARLRFNDFGWDVGGPILRNKLFIFAGEEWKKIRQDEAVID